MASADDYAAWIVKNADKKGTPEFDTVAAAYKEAKVQEQEQSLPEIIVTPETSGQPVGEIPGPRNYALSEVPGKMVSNAPESLVKFAGNVVAPIVHPVDTFMGLGDLLGGVMEPVTPDFLYGKEALANAKTARSGIADFFANRYGGYENLKRTMAEDPVGFLGDLSTVFSGGTGLAKLTGKIERKITGSAAVNPNEAMLVKGFDTAARYTNPLTPFAATGKYAYGKLVPESEKVAADIARKASGEDLEKIRALLNKDQSGLTVQELLADLDRNQIHALGELARTKDTTNFYSKLDKYRAQQNETTLNNLAGGATNTEILNNLAKSKEALTQVTTPMRETELAAANTGKYKQVLDRQATTLGEIASSKVDDVRRFTAARQRLNAAKTQADLSPNVSKDRLKFTGEMEDAAERVATKAAEDSLKYGEGARFAQARADSLAAHNLKPLDIDGVIRDINAKLNNPKIGVSDVNRKVLSTVVNKIKEWTARNGGVIDVEALYSIRKDTVNETIDALMAGKDPKTSAKYASKLLGEVRPLIDDAIIKAGGTGWKDYLDTFSHGMDVINQRKMAQVARDLYKKSDKTDFIKLVRGESPELVEQIFGHGRIDIKAEMGGKFKALDDVAHDLERSGKIKAGAEKGAAHLKDIVVESSPALRIPMFGLKARIGNEVLRELSGKINTRTMAILEKGFQSGKNFEDMLNEVPFGDRGRVYNALQKVNRANLTGSATVSNALAPENRNNLGK